MRHLPTILAFVFVFTNALHATDFPTVKTALPDITTPGNAVPSIDLRNHFEATSIQGPVAQFRTTLGTFNLELFPAAAPATVPNFLTYVNGGRYVDTFIHRSDQGLGVIQGGGYEVTATDPLNVERIATDPPIVLEYNLANARGTIAMARTSVLNSATSEWFINTDDNTTQLGQANGGGYAVFGRVTGTGMTVVDAIHALTVYPFQSPFGQLPLIGYSQGSPVNVANLVMINGAESVPIFPTTAGQNSVVSFSLMNSNPALVTATLSGSMLNLTLVAGQIGFSDLTVTATDSNGNTVQDTFRIDVTAVASDIAIEQPAGTDIADGGIRAFPSVKVGSTGDLVFTIKNPGNGDLALNGTPKVAVDGANANEFTVTAQPASPVAASLGSTTFTVRFAPATPGLKTAVLHIASDDFDEALFDINLTGVGEAPEIVVEQPVGANLADHGSRAFPLVNVSSTADLAFTIKNTGDADLLLTGTPKVTVDGADAGMFTATSQPASSVGSGGTTTFTVRFAPTSAGQKSAALHIANDDADESPFDINLTGTANAGPTLMLPDSPVTATATSANGAVVAFTITADDLEDGPLTPTVAPPNGSTFAIGDTTVQVSATDSNGAQTSGSFTVRVLPQPPEIIVEQPAGNEVSDGGNRAFPVVNVGGMVDLNFTIKNVGGGNLALSGNPKVVVDGPDASHFTVITQPLSPIAGPGGSTTFTVRFAPTSNGQKMAALHIASNDSDESSFELNLTGTGNALPTLTLPASPIFAEPTSSSGAHVNFVVTANDAEDGPLTAIPSHTTSTPFPLGETIVNVTATDSNGAVVTGSFTVSIGFQRPAEPTVTVIAQSGEIAPGAGYGGPLLDSVLETFGPPAINDYRVVAARVTLRAGSTTLAGIYGEDGTGLRWMAAYQGGPVPGGYPDTAFFKKFSEPVIASNGAIAFVGKLGGAGIVANEDSGVWTNAFAGGMRPVLREGSLVPDSVPTSSRLKSVSSVSLHDSDVLALLTLQPVKDEVNEDNDTVLWRLQGAYGDTLLREGRALPGVSNSKVKSFRVLSPAQGSPGHGRWHSEGTIFHPEGEQGGIIAKVTFFNGRTAVVKIASSNGTASALLSSSDPAIPVSPLARWKSFGLPAINRTAEGFAVAASLKVGLGGVLEKNDNVLLYSTQGAEWSVFAREGAAAPVTPAGPRYASFFDPLVNDEGHIAFLATLRGSGVNASNQTALFSGPANDPQLIARLGDPVPDETGATTTSVWSKFISVALPSGPDAGPIFLAKTTGGETTTTNNIALWALDSQGTVRRLLRTGDALSTGGSPITSLNLLNASTGAFGVTRSFNATGSVALAVTLADGTQALLRVDIP